MVDPYLGQINMVAFDFAPRGWAQCDGQVFAIIDNQALFALISNLYGGDGRNTFALPDFRGRVPIHKGHGPGSNYNHQIGDRGGAEEVTLTLDTMPRHHHEANTANMASSIPAKNGNANTKEPDSDKVLAIANNGAAIGNLTYPIYSSDSPDTTIKGGDIDGDISIEDTGKSEAHYNMQPFLAVNFVISLNGLFPPRN